jgi:hypothetical protein
MNDAENLTQLLDHLPPAVFRDFLAREFALAIPTHNVKRSPQKQRTHMAAVLSGIDVVRRQSIENVAETILLLSDTRGQQVVDGFRESIRNTPARAAFDTLRNPYERALWLYQQEPVVFYDALDAQLADNVRPRAPCYAGFVAPKHLAVGTNADAINPFHARVAQLLECNKDYVAVHVFKRLQPDTHTVALYHIRLHHNGPTDIIERVQTRELNSQRVTRAVTSYITYEPATGYLDVLTPDPVCREKLAHLTADTLLQAPRLSATLPLKQYDYQCLAAPRPFDLGDEPITSVKVIELSTTHAHRTLRVNIGIHDIDDIYTAATAILGPTFDFRQHRLTSATLSIHVKNRGQEHARILTVVLRDTHLCNINTLREHDRALCDHLLMKWRLVKVHRHVVEAPLDGVAACTDRPV